MHIDVLDYDKIFVWVTPHNRNENVIDQGKLKFDDVLFHSFDDIMYGSKYIHEFKKLIK